MRISISIAHDPLELTLDIEHPMGEVAMDRAVLIMRLVRDNMFYPKPPPGDIAQEAKQ